MSDSDLAEVIEYLTERHATFPRDSVTALLVGALEVFAPEVRQSGCNAPDCGRKPGHMGPHGGGA